MIFTGREDFLAKAAECERLPREIEKAYALAAKEGSAEAIGKIIDSYLPVIAAFFSRQSRENQTLELAYRLYAALEKAASGFDFLQESETFLHRLSFAMRQELARYIAEK